jgi:histidine ammonia-lyase
MFAMAATGYEEEARHAAQTTVLPGSESGGFGQNDVASPVFLAWSRAERAAEALDMTLASLAPIALRAFKVTGREPTSALAHWQAPILDAFPGLDTAEPLGPRAAELAATLRARILEQA